MSQIDSNRACTMRMRVNEHPCITVCRRDLVVRHKNRSAMFEWLIIFTLTMASNIPLMQHRRTLGWRVTRRGCFVGRIGARRTRTWPCRLDQKYLVRCEPHSPAWIANVFWAIVVKEITELGSSYNWNIDDRSNLKSECIDLAFNLSAAMGIM